MAGEWKERFRELRWALKGGSVEKSNKPVDSVDDNKPPSFSMARRRPEEIRAYFGIDFGTRFTKVVMHLPRSDARVPLLLGLDGSALHPTRLAVCHGAAFPPDVIAPPNAIWVDYLKMRLFTGGGAEFEDGSSRPRTEIAALSALYIAGVLRLAQASAMKAGHLPRDAVIKWFAQVGVPAKTYDSADLVVFEEMAAVAWSWKDEAPASRSIDDLVTSYLATRESRLSREDSPIIVAPELVAAISHIASRRDAPEGLYALLDIGGGTLDATTFALRRTPYPTVDILAAQVEPLGTIAIARKIAPITGGIESVEKRLVAGRLADREKKELKRWEEKVASVLRRVIAEAVKKCPAMDFVALGQSDLDRRLRTGAYRSIVVMLAGGGAESHWYTKVFESLDMHQWAVDKLKTRIIPRPSGWIEDNYPRFVVANGLSNRDLQLHHYRLPTDISEIPPLPDRQMQIESPISKDLV